ncbi:hypothetical protein SAMN04487830_1146 [Pseudobutyrivibrio sp. OR37]|uniref:hypothetical protein n=1 Tax=Pseudobutyrivibrio sp. OR37 TaxID=1798186 RepID=UPI0008EB56F1|nr:hypothetical protein [Pseudobutyrivibrio sp. OR37]SFH94690.1 hypothetical protein SAMN04487830_1146 [Pseudobutyrivibrio sp. OR37]
MTFSLSITLIFWAYIAVWIQIPGMLIGNFLFPRRLKLSTRILAGFFIGFLYLATLYFLESMSKLNGLIMVAGPITTIIAIIVYLKKGKPSFYNADEHFRWTGIIIFGFIYLVSVLNFQLKYMGALDGRTVQVYHDYLFHTGNIVSLSRSFPNTDIRIEGLTFYYHYYYELIFAMCKHIFKMDAFRLYMNGNALMCAMPTTVALMIIGERIRGGKITHRFNYFVYCAGTLVSLICVMPLNIVGIKLPVSWLDNHLFSNANALGMAMALSVLVVDILVEVWYDKLSVKVLVGLYLLSAAATGFKGTTGILLVAITWSVYVIESLILKKFHLPRFLYAVVVTLGFAFTYMVVTVGLNSSGSNNRAMKLSPEGTIGAGRVGQIITKLGFDYMSFPWVVIAVVLCAICIIGPMIFAFTGFTVSKFKTLIHEGVIGDIFDWFVIGSVIMGVIGFCFITVPGMSQGYFVITNAGFIFYGAIRYAVDHRKSLVAYVTFASLAVGTLCLAADVAYFCYDDVKQAAVFKEQAGDEPSKVSDGMMDAYIWLRDNTPEDSVVAVDRFSEETDYRSIFFYCSAFSERQCYLEGYDYSDVTEKQIEAMMSINNKFFSDNVAEAETAMDMSGVDYLVVTNMQHPNYKAKSQKLSLVFTNEEVDIYKFNSDGGLTTVN